MKIYLHKKFKMNDVFGCFRYLKMKQVGKISLSFQGFCIDW